MKTIARFLLSLLLVLSLTAQSQILRNKKYDLATAGSSISINLASDVQMIFVSGTKTLSAPYSIGVTGTPIDGKTILLFYDGTSLTTSGNAVTLLGVTLGDKQATSKLVALSIYKTSSWVTRIFNDVTNTEWIQYTDFGSTAYDDSTIHVAASGLRVKPSGITNTHIGASAAIAKSKLALTHAIDSGDISLTAKIPFSKMLPLTATKVPYIGADGFLAASAVTPTELGYLSGVTSAIQTQLGTKTTSGAIVNADISGSAAIAYSKLNLAGTLVNADIATACSLAWAKMYPLTASRVPYINSSGVIAASSVTDTELGYLSGVTSAVQTQINNARSSRTYTKTSTTPLVLNSSATDSYLITVSTTPIVVTLPAAADFDQYHIIEFTRLGTVADSSVTIIAAGGDAIEGVSGSDVSSYILSKATAGGAGVSFISNGVDAWIYNRKW
jgi:hypothetical protein